MPLLTELATFVLAVAIKIVLLRSKDLRNVLTLGRGTKCLELLSLLPTTAMSESIADYPANVQPRKPGLFSVLWNELKPFPGRDLAALRMALVCTALVLFSNTFRLPFQDVIPFLALFTAKEEKITTTITADLALVAVTVSVGAALLIFKCTGNRPGFRISPAMAGGLNFRWVSGHF